MSQYPSSDQNNYSYAPTYQPGVPQYTQAQIYQYYAQYQCYPPQPYHVIEEQYVAPVAVGQPAYHQQTANVPTYDPQWQTQPDHVGQPLDQTISR